MENINAGIADLAVPIEHVRRHPQDPFRGDVATVAQFLARHGQYRPIVVQASSGCILKGSDQYEAALSLGWTRIAATLRDLDDVTARRVLAADIATSALGDYDEAMLADLLTPLDALDLLSAGYAAESLKLLSPPESPRADPGPPPGPAAEQSARPALDQPVGPPLAVREAMLLYPPGDLPSVLADLAALSRKWDEPDHAAIVLRALEETAAEL